MIWLFPYHILYQPSTNIILRAKALGLIQDVIQKEPYNILYLSCVKIKGKNLQIIDIDITSTYLISAYQVGNMILSISEVYMIQLSVIKSTVLFWVLQIPPPIKLTATI